VVIPFPAWRQVLPALAKHIGGREPTFYFHPLIRWCSATPGGSESLTGALCSFAGSQLWVRTTMAAGLEKVREIVDRVAQSSGLEVVEVELHGGGKARVLRIYIDKPSGVTHEDCSNFSREVSTIFDVEDAVPGGSYMLEVSSPGLDRKLSNAADFERFTGSLVKLMTRDPVNGNRHFEGRLIAFQGGRLSLELTGRKKSKKHEAVEHGTEVEIELANVEKANLVPEFAMGSPKSNK
jgi:ribosome maturation factor RimP